MVRIPSFVVRMKPYTIFLLWLMSFSYSVSAQDCNKEVLYFKNNSYRIEEDQQDYILKVLNSLNKEQTYLFEIGGHTDEKHGSGYNRKLAGRRMDNVIDIIESQGFKNIIIYRRNFGETKPVSNKNKLNRRVEINFKRLNKDKTITLFGNDGVQVSIPYQYFRNQEYCDCNPILTNVENQMGIRTLRIESDCFRGSRCLQAEFRIPFSQFEVNDGQEFPAPLNFHGCLGFNSINPKKGFKDSTYSYDLQTREYIINFDCLPWSGICCGFRGGCRNVAYEVILPNDVGILTAFVESLNAQEPIALDPDTTSIDPSRFQKDYRTVRSAAFIDGELHTLSLDMDSLFKNKKVVFLGGDSCLYRMQIPLDKYEVVRFSKKKVVVKLPHKNKVDSVGFYLRDVDFIYPIDSQSPRKFSSQSIRYSHDIALSLNGYWVVVKKKKFKKRVKRKANTTFYKLRKRQLRMLLKQVN